MRILFAGTPDIAVPSLEKLFREHEVAAVLTNPDRGRGRGRGVGFSPVKVKAEELGLKVLQPEKIDDEFISEVRKLNADILAVVAFGKIFRENFIDVFPHGGLNVHPSLLPKFRGASPIQSALLSGEPLTGVTIQRLALKMDSGDILSQETYEYNGTETAEYLTNYFAGRGAELLSDVIRKIEAGEAEPVAQNDEEASYCSYIQKEDGLIDWSDSAEVIERKLRAFTPWPGIYTFFGEKKLNIIEAEVYTGSSTAESGSCSDGKVLGIDKSSGILVKTGNGILAVQRLQLQSKKALDWKSFINGVKDFNDAVLGG